MREAESLWEGHKAPGEGKSAGRWASKSERQELA